MPLYDLLRNTERTGLSAISSTQLPELRLVGPIRILDLSNCSLGTCLTRIEPENIVTEISATSSVFISQIHPLFLSIQKTRSMDELCERCIKIPKPIYFRRSSHFPSRSIGTRKQIEARKDKCPFCRLIYNALFDNPIKYDIGEDSRLGVIWNGEYYYFSAGHWEDIAIKIAVIQEENAEPSPANFARSVAENKVNLKLVQSWLDLCQENHQPGSLFQQMLGGEDDLERPARLYDTQDMRVVASEDTEPDMKYVALSYVWGDANNYRLNSKNKADLMTVGFFKSVHDQLPKTIRDSMELVSRLGMRYIWIDVLCIIQDDMADKTREMYRMDSIYEGSEFTIVAAAGTDANAGLPPLRARQAQQDYETIWSNVRMTAIHDVQDILRCSRYGTRGWTFQEQTLSSRLLIFTGTFVYCHCHECIWSEDSRSDTQPRQRSRIGGPRRTSSIVSIHQDPWMSYCTHLASYSSRHLTNDGDRIDAMMGILQRIRRKLKCRLLHGMLSDPFEYSLFFTVTSCQRHSMFPSYSWAGWKGEVNLGWPLADYFPDMEGSTSEEDEESAFSGESAKEDDQEWESDEDSDSDNDDQDSSGSDSSSPSESQYDYHTSDVDSNEGSDVSLGLSDEEENTRRGVEMNTWIVWYERPPNGSPQLVHDKENDQHPDRQRDMQATKRTHFTARAGIKMSVDQTHPVSNPQLTHMQYSVLQFWTISLKLHLRKFGVPSKHLVDLVDSKDRWCGQLRIPHDYEPDYEKVAEVILLMATDSQDIMQENSRMFNKVESLARTERRDAALPDFYRVMWIQWRKGIAERVAIGEIYHSSLQCPVEGKTVWKEIVLG